MHVTVQFMPIDVSITGGVVMDHDLAIIVSLCVAMTALMSLGPGGDCHTASAAPSLSLLWIDADMQLLSLARIGPDHSRIGSVGTDIWAATTYNRINGLVWLLMAGF